MIFIPLAVILISIFYFWWIFTQRRGLKLPPKVPNSLPVIGAAHTILGKDSKYLYKWMDKIGKYCIEQGGVIYGTAGPYIVYAVADAEDAYTVLTQCNEKNWIYNFIKQWTGDGIVTVTDKLDLHRRHRKLISRAFNQQILDSYISVFNRQSKRLIEKFSEKVGKGNFDHVPILEEISMGTMYQTTLGFNENETNNTYEAQISAGTRKILRIFAKRFQTFYMYSPFIYRFTSLKKEEDETIERLHFITNETIQQKKKALHTMESKSRKVKSFLDLMLELTEQDAFNDKELRDEVQTMIVAGSDTSATMNTYALMLLGSHPEIQEKVYEELREVFNDSMRDIEKQDFAKLVLLEGVLMETMRLYPIIPALMRYVAADTKLKNYTLAAGSSVFVLVHNIHRDPAVWGPDAEEFNPQRWVPPNSPSPGALKSFAGFSIGKRACLGKSYAMMSMKATLAHVLRHYKVYSDISKLELELDMLLKANNGTAIALERRTRTGRELRTGY